MKRLFPILLLAVAGLSCSDRRPEFVIGVSQCSDDEWREKMNLEMVRESRFYPGTEVVILSAHDDNVQQIQDIESLAAKGVDLLVVAPNEARAIAPAVEKVFDEGIPVVLVDRKTDSDKYTAYIGADNYEIGQAIGKYAGGRLHGKGKIVELTGLRASTPARERHEGFTDGISGYPDVEVVSSADAGWSGPSAAAVFDSILAVTPDIDMVVSHNDRMALGAYDAARRAGRAGNMLFVGVDALTAPGLGVEKVLDGTLDATFIYPTGGDKVIQVAMSILKDRPYERETLLSTALVDGSNARIMQMQTAHINALDEKIEYLNTRLGNSMVRFYSYRIYLIVCVGLLVLVAALMLFLVRERNRLKEQGKELVRQRDQSLELSRKLEEATRSKLAFFTNVAHDFRTPLTLIADPVDRLRVEKDRFNEHDRYLLDMVHKNVTLLLRLVNQILDFRKYESGKLSLNLSDFDAVAAVKDWAEVFRPRMEQYVSLSGRWRDAGALAAECDRIRRRAPRRCDALETIASFGDGGRDMDGAVPRRLLDIDGPILAALRKAGYVEVTERERHAERGGVPRFAPPRLTEEQSRVAAEIRASWASGMTAHLLRGVTGSGKTELLCATVRAKPDNSPEIVVIEGDQQTDNDANRIRETGAKAVQINTGKGCHLDAEQVKLALQQAKPAASSLVFIENVGNLVCPAEFDLGEAHKVVVISVTEGDDKPLKYPDMFAAADLMIINKVDLAPYVKFDLDKCEENARRVNPSIRSIRMSATTGEGISKWWAWLTANHVIAQI